MLNLTAEQKKAATVPHPQVQPRVRLSMHSLLAHTRTHLYSQPNRSIHSHTCSLILLPSPVWAVQSSPVKMYSAEPSSSLAHSWPKDPSLSSCCHLNIRALWTTVLLHWYRLSQEPINTAGWNPPWSPSSQTTIVSPLGDKHAHRSCSSVTQTSPTL